MEKSAGTTLSAAAEMPTPVGATLAKHGAYVITLGPPTEPMEVPLGVRNAKKSAAGFCAGSRKYSNLGSPARGRLHFYQYPNKDDLRLPGRRARCGQG